MDDLDKLLEKEKRLEKELGETKKEISLLLSNSIPDYADLMTLEDFKEACKLSCFIDYDGWGYLSDGEREYGRLLVKPSYLTKTWKVPDPKFTHVCWYNK